MEMILNLQLESLKDEDSITRNFNGRESQRIEPINAREIDINKTILEEEPQPETINHHVKNSFTSDNS